MNKEGINLGESQESPESAKERLLKEVNKLANVVKVDIDNFIALASDMEPREANNELSWFLGKLEDFVKDYEQGILVRDIKI